MSSTAEVRHGTVYRFSKGCRCEPCRESIRTRNNKRVRQSKANQKLPIEPMEGALPESFAIQYRSNIVNWRTKGISVFMVDRICVSYGLHPYAVYGDAWWQDLWDKEASPR